MTIWKGGGEGHTNIFSTVYNVCKFREGSEARAYHAAASKDWHWDGYHIAAELSDKTAIKTAEGGEPRKKYSRKRF